MKKTTYDSFSCASEKRLYGVAFLFVFSETISGMDVDLLLQSHK